MNITIEKLPECRAAIRVEVPSDAVESRRDEITRLFLRQGNIPGFRPGKAPVSVVRSRYARQIESELRDRLIGEGYREGMDTDDLKVLSATDVKDPMFHIDGRFTFTVEVITAPDFTLPDYKSMTLRVPKAEITEQNVDNAIESLRERTADYPEVQGRALAGGDVAVIDYHGFIDGKPIREVAGEAPDALYHAHDYWLHVKEPNFLPGFCDGVTGMNAGETRSITVRIPEDFAVKEVAGMEAVYEVELKQILQQILPELDDGFARKTGLADDAAGLRTAIRERLERDLANRLAGIKREQIINQLNAQTAFDIPRKFIEQAVQRRVEELVQENQRRGVPEDDIIEHQEDILAAADQQARFDVKTNFILTRIAEQEKITADSDEVQSEIMAAAVTAGRTKAQVAKLLRNSSVLQRFRENIVVRKTIELISSSATIEEVEVPNADSDPGPGSTD